MSNARTRLAVLLAALVAACSSNPATGGGGAGGASSSASSASGANTGGAMSAGGSGHGGEGATGGGGGSSGTCPHDGSGGGSADKTAAGVPLPSGWSLKISDRFGTGPGRNVGTFAALHAKYYEGQSYNRDANGLVKIPNVVINHEQETYVHFEQSIVFGCDHLTIQGRGHADGSITSGEMVSIHAARSFCVEAKYRIPSADKSWPAFWFYGDASGHDASEIDVEQPITPNQGVHDVSLHNHPTEGTVTIVDPHFTTAYMTYSNPAFDASAGLHAYTACYDDASSLLTRYIDGVEIYSDVWKWNASLGGTGHGPDASTIVNLAVGGDWPGNVADPASYSADFDVDSIDYYEP